MSTPSFTMNEEEQRWLEAAKTLDEGRGVDLKFIDPEDMVEAMTDLNISGYAAKTRFKSFLHRLRQPLQQQTLSSLMSSLALRRKVPCRLWVGDDSHTLYNLDATSFEELERAARSTFKLDQEEMMSLYYLLDKHAVESRRYISNDKDLNDYFNLAGDPIVFVWLRGESNISPGSLPSQVEIKAASIASSPSSISDTTRGYVQTLFRNSVRARDGYACVLSGKKLKAKANNVQAAHIIGVEPALAEVRRAAGITNAYDTWNGMLLETSLHSAFNSFLWCMDEFGVVHVSDKGKEDGHGSWEGKRIKLRIGKQQYPSMEILRARFQLYQEKQIHTKPAKGARKRKSGLQTI